MRITKTGVEKMIGHLPDFQTYPDEVFEYTVPPEDSIGGGVIEIRWMKHHEKHDWIMIGNSYYFPQKP